ncbi:MAG: sarcosine oxidase subunit gamma family protein [Pseudomonadota bacterium]
MSDISVSIVRHLGMVTLRGDLDVLAAAVASVTGCARPDMRKRTTNGDAALLWMSPDELLLLCPEDRTAPLVQELEAALSDSFATVAVVSDARAVFDVAGPGAAQALAKLMPVDFPKIAPDEVRRTRMAQVAAAVWAEGQGYRVVCFRSVAEYADRLLRNAASVGA